MRNTCVRCDQPIHDGERVLMEVEGVYHAVPSKIAFALGKDMIFVPGTLTHVDCSDPLYNENTVSGD